MNATKTYRQTADTAQELAERIVHAVPDAATLKSAASDAAHRAGQILEDTAASATDWVGEASSNAIAMLPMVAAKRARRRRRLFGAGLALIPLVYFFDPKNGADRRAKVKTWVANRRSTATTTTPSFSTQVPAAEQPEAAVTD